ncbi:MAG: 1-deoxy-D-xylulose-5-phosphate reductoisomerase, partial [Syntrophomonadaceae bacterium]|nr:1-deoxy-D-xylulose-5-phosphate reductoisomerase [Syntrophomonadaceae bacterium]
MNNTKKIVILGSTGSIGRQALEVIDNYPDLFQVVGLAARAETSQLLEQIRRYKPQAAAIGDETAYKELTARNSLDVQLMAGVEGLCELASWERADMVLVAVSGAIGILPTLAAIKAGKSIALANKETLVAAGDIIIETLADAEGALLPVDSEHSAVFQCLAGEKRHLENIWLTASGGPFRNFSEEQLQKVTLEMALKHPNWNMGPKITVDSASLMNKGLEVIEAHHLFSIDYEHIKVVIHQESVVHSLIELVDGSFLAHLGKPDMKMP